jgi:glutamine amidotransferase
VVKVTVFDYGVGNLHSLGKGLEAGGAAVTLSRDWREALSAQALVLPGVGSFGAASQSLQSALPELRSALEGGLPCLGICLGMQLLFEGSDEGEGEGVGLFRGRARRLRTSVVPQMGWNDVTTGPDPLFEGLEGLVAYFANSFVCEAHDPEDVIAMARCEDDVFTAGVRRANTWAVQFHPEKSSKEGLHVLRNFLAQVP